MINCKICFALFLSWLLYLPCFGMNVRPDLIVKVLNIHRVEMDTLGNEVKLHFAKIGSSNRFIVPQGQFKTLEKKCFRILINYLTSRGVLSEDIKVYFIVFSNLKDEKYFAKKVKYQGKTLRFRKFKRYHNHKIITVQFVEELSDNQIEIGFKVINEGEEFKGTVLIGTKGGEPVYLKSYLTMSIE